MPKDQTEIYEFPVKEVCISDIAFPRDVIGRLLPRQEDIPKVFKDGFATSSTKWHQAAEAWFYCGAKDFKFIVKDGIDLKKAQAHLSACLRSLEPEHEHRIAGVAYLMSLWFERIVIGEFCE